jgi:predicted nucleic acid-binding protein
LTDVLCSIALGHWHQRGLTQATGPSRDLLQALVDMKAFVLVTSMEILAELGVERQVQAIMKYTSFM